MNISVIDFRSNPFSSNIVVDIVLDGNTIKILNRFGSTIFHGEHYSARKQITNLLKELDEKSIITTKAIFAVSCKGVTSLMDIFRETLRELAFRYATTNVKVEIQLTHLDYNN